MFTRITFVVYITNISGFGLLKICCTSNMCLGAFMRVVVMLVIRSLAFEMMQLVLQSLLLLALIPEYQRCLNRFAVA